MCSSAGQETLELKWGHLIFNHLLPSLFGLLCSFLIQQKPLTKLPWKWGLAMGPCNSLNASSYASNHMWSPSSPSLLVVQSRVLIKVGSSRHGALFNIMSLPWLLDRNKRMSHLVATPQQAQFQVSHKNSKLPAKAHDRRGILWNREWRRLDHVTSISLFSQRFLFLL
jgi:hypothetical protein